MQYNEHLPATNNYLPSRLVLVPLCPCAGSPSLAGAADRGQQTQTKTIMKTPLDKIVARLVALGIPGLVLVSIVYFVGPAGGATIITALALLGGPLGMMGGIAVLVLSVLVSKVLAEYGFEKVFVAVLK